MGVPTLQDLPITRGSRVLVRVDHNVPLDEAGHVSDDTRLVESLPTLRALTARGAVVIVLSHLGRPGGTPHPALSLRPVAARLQQLMEAPVSFVPATVGDEAERAVAAAAPGSVVVLENLRFHRGEAANDPAFAEALARLGQFYVNDAFGTAHRAHASTVGLPARLPRAAGLLVERELRALDDLRRGPPRPYWAIVGGAKVADKLTLLEHLLSQVDGLVIGGGMANTFLAATGHSVGASRIEADQLDAARALVQAGGDRLVLPQDVVAARAFAADAARRVVPVDAVGPDEVVMDVGPKTLERLAQVLAGAATVFWNGPLGVFEWPAFAEGTLATARLLARLPARVVVGGGDSGAAVAQAGLSAQFAHVSTGGGAALAYIQGRELPGVAALGEGGGR